MCFTVAAAFDKGPFRAEDQDSLLVLQAKGKEGEFLLSAVCDGMGGLSKGELASAQTVRELSAWFYDCLENNALPAEVSCAAAEISSVLERANKKIFKFAAKNGIEMGTTASVLFLCPGGYTAVHIGDSRICELTESLLCLTRDDSFTAGMVLSGRMTPAQAKEDPRRNMLLQCIGAAGSISLQVCTGKICCGAYLLCSDGFWRTDQPKTLCGILKREEPSERRIMERSLNELIKRARLMGEKDNICAVLIKTDMEG